VNTEWARKLEYVPCALCDSDRTEFLLEDRGYRLVKCRRCGLVYVNPRPIRQELQSLYGSSDETGNVLMDNVGYTEFAYLHELQAKKRLGIIKKYKHSGKVLDVGCAAGYFLSVARDQGFDPYGVEISKTLCNLARRNFGLNVSCGTLTEMNYPGRFFDVVTLFDVLSHLPKPVESFNEINRILADDGLLLVETGNKGEISPGAVDKWGDTWGSPSHLYHFGTSTFMKLLEMTGFDCFSLDKYPLVLSSSLELMVRTLARSKKNHEVSYRRMQFGHAPATVKEHLTRVGAHLYLFVKYGVGKLLPQSNLDCTIIARCKKR
jgi:SAM-dependent methyltransferase